MATATPAPKVNHIGLPVLEYRGGKSTLCAGCGHNAISERIIDAMFEMGVEPERVMKMSGIGCSSKSPAYFMSRSHSFNSVHGRMPAISTGAILANHTMTTIGVSGDGDTASIGMGQFVHLMRRNLPMIYIIEDNGVYGLTKGQFSATADLGSKLKTGVVNDLPAIDTCALAIQLGATFVARSFSGDKKQLLSMLKAAIAHKGTVMLDVISPCVTFNDHEGSTKSYKFMQENDEPINEIGFVASFDEIEVDYDSGQVYEVEMHDGSNLRLRKLLEDYDPTDKANAVRTLMESQQNDEILTGVFYINTEKPTFIDLLNVVDEPLATLPESVTRPPKSGLRCADGHPQVRGPMTGDPSSDERELLTSAYREFNARNIDAVLALMHPDVVWPNGMEGGYVHGHDGVREYWTRQWGILDPHVEPMRMERDQSGRIVVHVHQVVRDLTGKVLIDTMVRHAYTIRQGLIERMEIE